VHGDQGLDGRATRSGGLRPRLDRPAPDRRGVYHGGPTVYSRLSEPAIPPVTQRPALGCLFEVVETLVLTVLIFLGIQTFVAQPYKVQQGSMETTLLPDQYVLVDKLTPRWSPYARGDIVVFEPPETWSSIGGVPFIKRVIGLPGDTVELRDGKVFVNRVELDEPYIYEEDGLPQATDPQPGGGSEWVVPQNQLLVMGDHRQNSADSRSFGPIEVSHVIGRAWLRYWPFDTFGVLPTPTHPELDSIGAPRGSSPPSDAPEPEESPSAAAGVGRLAYPFGASPAG
jgi:signal peptidase I